MQDQATSALALVGGPRPSDLAALLIYRKERPRAVERTTPQRLFLHASGGRIVADRLAVDESRCVTDA